MKILLMFSYYVPEVTSAAHLVKDMLDAMADNDFEMKIITPYPTRGVEDEVRKEYIKNKKTEVKYDGRLKIKRFPLMKESKNSLQRALRYFFFIVGETIEALKSRGYDVIYVPSTPPVNGLMMWVLKKFKKAKIVYNLQDIFPDSLVHTGMTKKGSLIWKIGRFVENVTYKSADKIIVISKGFKKNVMEKGVPEEKTELIYNWINENQVVNIERKDNKLFDKYNLDRDKFYICYSGNIGNTQNIELLVQVAEKLSNNPDIMFVIIGEGACKEKLISLTKEKNLQNVKILPFQDYSDISHVFSLGDCGLVISKKGIGEASVPSKTWSIMSSQRAVLASFDKGTELDEIITDNNCGICVDADDCDALADAINTLYTDKDAVKEMGKNGRNYVINNLTKEICTSRYVDVFKSM